MNLAVGGLALGYCLPADAQKPKQADGDKAYGDQNTDGSNSIRGIYEDMRRVGATARVMLIAAAAKRWPPLPDGDQRRGDGRALGLAAHRSFLSYTAVVASVVKRPDGKLAVDEVWLAFDAGTVVSVDRVRAQMEGSVILGRVWRCSAASP